METLRPCAGLRVFHIMDGANHEVPICLSSSFAPGLGPEKLCSSEVVLKSNLSQVGPPNLRI